MDRVHIAVTGEILLGQGVRAIEGVLQDLFHEARESLHIAVYTISPSAIPLLKTLEIPLLRGVSVYLLVSSMEDLDPAVRNALAELREKFPAQFEIRDFQRSGKVLHAKVIVADRKKALVGSANLSWSGLMNNIEIGVLIEGMTSWDLASLIDRLMEAAG